MPEVTNAAELGEEYRSFGFTEYKRRRVYHTPISGFRYSVSVKLTQHA